MKINDLKELEDLIQLVKQYKLDFIEVDNIKITKTRHEEIIAHSEKQSAPTDFWMNPFEVSDEQRSFNGVYR